MPKPSAKIKAMQDNLGLEKILQRHDAELAKAKGEVTSGAELTGITSVSPSAALSAKKYPAVQPNNEAENKKAAKLSAGAAQPPSSTNKHTTDSGADDDKGAHLEKREDPNRHNSKDKDQGKKKENDMPVNIWDLLLSGGGEALTMLYEATVGAKLRADGQKHLKAHNKLVKTNDALRDLKAKGGETAEKIQEGIKEAEDASLKTTPDELKALRVEHDENMREFLKAQKEFEAIEKEMPEALGTGKIAAAKSMISPMSRKFAQAQVRANHTLAATVFKGTTKTLSFITRNTLGRICNQTLGRKWPGMKVSTEWYQGSVAKAKGDLTKAELLKENFEKAKSKLQAAAKKVAKSERLLLASTISLEAKANGKDISKGECHAFIKANEAEVEYLRKVQGTEEYQLGIDKLVNKFKEKMGIETPKKELDASKKTELTAGVSKEPTLKTPISAENDAIKNATSKLSDAQLELESLKKTNALIAEKGSKELIETVKYRINIARKKVKKLKRDLKTLRANPYLKKPFTEAQLKQIEKLYESGDAAKVEAAFEEIAKCGEAAENFKQLDKAARAKIGMTEAEYIAAMNERARLAHENLLKMAKAQSKSDLSDATLKDYRALVDSFTRNGIKAKPNSTGYGFIFSFETSEKQKKIEVDLSKKTIQEMGSMDEFIKAKQKQDSQITEEQAIKEYFSQALEKQNKALLGKHADAKEEVEAQKKYLQGLKEAREEVNKSRDAYNLVEKNELSTMDSQIRQQLIDLSKAKREQAEIGADVIGLCVQQAEIREIELDTNEFDPAELSQYYLNENSKRLENAEKDLASMNKSEDQNAYKEKTDEVNALKADVAFYKSELEKNLDLPDPFNGIAPPGPVPLVASKQAQLATQERLAEDSIKELESRKETLQEMGQMAKAEAIQEKIEEWTKLHEDILKKEYTPLPPSSAPDELPPQTPQSQEDLVKELMDMVPPPPPRVPSSSVLPKRRDPAPNMSQKNGIAIYKSADPNTNSKPQAPKPKQNKSFWQKAASFFTRDKSDAVDLTREEADKIYSNIDSAALRKEETPSGVGEGNVTLSKKQVGGSLRDDVHLAKVQELEKAQAGVEEHREKLAEPDPPSSDSSPSPTGPYS